jgi:hypothetical protein
VFKFSGILIGGSSLLKSFKLSFNLLEFIRVSKCGNDFTAKGVDVVEDLNSLRSLVFSVFIKLVS